MSRILYRSIAASYNDTCTKMNEYLKIAKLSGELFWGELFILSYNPHKWPKLNGCYRKIAPWWLGTPCLFDPQKSLKEWILEPDSVSMQAAVQSCEKAAVGWSLKTWLAWWYLKFEEYRWLMNIV